MRILHVTASLAPRHGGPTEAALGMVRALRAMGEDARIVSSNDDVGDTLDVPLHRWTEHGGVPVWFLPRVKARQHTLVGFTFTPGFPAWMQRHARENDFIHVHTVFSHPANSAMSAARQSSVPYCVRPLGQLCRWSLRQRRLVKSLQLAWATRRNINGARFIHCTSDMEAAETAEAGFRSPCKVLPHGLEMPPVTAGARKALRDALGVPQDRRLVVFMSRFHEKKGLELLLEAMALKAADFDLVLAGTGEAAYVAGLKRRVAGSGLEKRVHWLEFVTGEAKWRLLQGGDVFVLPSQSENFGIVILEAMACGLPVVVSDQVALMDEVRQHQLGHVVPREPQLLRRALDEMLEDAAGRGLIRERAPRLVMERYSWPAAAQRLADAYREAIATKPAP